jgi:hypothetical protein
MGYEVKMVSCRWSIRGSLGALVLISGAVVILGLALGACISAEQAAQEGFELAQFEERQGNADHARELYQQILDRYPATAWAEKARERLNALQPLPQPPPVPTTP